MPNSLMFFLFCHTLYGVSNNLIGDAEPSSHEIYCPILKGFEGVREVSEQALTCKHSSQQNTFLFHLTILDPTFL